MASPDLLTEEQPDVELKTEEPPSTPPAPSGNEADQQAPPGNQAGGATSECDNEGDNKAPGPEEGPPTCGVCEEVASKYKCPRCYLPYCSVACNKMHQRDHPPDPKPERSPEPPRQPPAEAAESLNPFQALDKSEKLVWLFRKYPNLPQQLLDIHSATQPPPEDPSKWIPASLMQGIPKRSGWNHDKGISRGKAALRRARRLPGEAGEAVREYCTLILLLLNEGEEANGGTRTVLQQQFAQQNADMIRQLMEEEKGLS